MRSQHVFDETIAHGTGTQRLFERRFYILNRLIGRVLEADATILSNVLEKLETWIEDLGELPDLEACYGREMLNLAYDIIHQQSKDVPASNLCSSQ